MSDEVLVKVEGVSKKFCRSLKRSLWYGVQDVSAEMIGRKGSHDELRKNEFWAVNDVSFELKRGECLGLIGLNGAGKSTLLKMLNGLVKPDRGRITMRGRVGALIELGAGFNPILTGRENVYINGSVLGFSRKEIDRKFDAIVDFAEIEEFIDTPVQNYSSGMKVRLGFAVAAQMEPDVLLIDEVLAVGDLGFRIKCLNALKEITKYCSIIFVSHVMQQVSFFCQRVLVIRNGMVEVDAANTSDGIDHYYGIVEQCKQESGTGAGRIAEITLLQDGIPLARDNPALETTTALTAQLRFAVSETIEAAKVVIAIEDGAEVPVRTFPVQNQKGEDATFGLGEHVIEISLGPIELNSGRYKFVAWLQETNSGTVIARVANLHRFRVVSRYNFWSTGVSPRIAVLVSQNTTIPTSSSKRVDL